MSETKNVEMVEISEVIEISELVGKLCAWLAFEPVLGLTSFIELVREPRWSDEDDANGWVLQLILGEEREAKLFLAKGDRMLSPKDHALLTYLLEEACFDVHLIDEATVEEMKKQSQNG